MPTLHVLIVDDEPTNREIAEVILTTLGHTVVQACNGEEAIAAASRQSFDLILMDVLMPVMDGLEATRLLRAHPATARVPVIMVSARVTAEDRAVGLEAGGNWYLCKPYRRSELMAAMTEVLEPGRGAVPAL